MSKAFTKEDGAPEPPTLRPPPKLAPGEVRYITAAGHAALLAERSALEAQHAALVGNTDLDTATRRLELEARLTSLEGLHGILTVTIPDPAQPDTIFFGAHVRLEDEDGEALRYQLVGPDETDVRAGRISVDSPIARQLLGRRVGDELELARPKGTVVLTVLEIRYG